MTQNKSFSHKEKQFSDKNKGNFFSRNIQKQSPGGVS